MFGRIPEAERALAISDVAAWLGTLGEGQKFKLQRHADAERGSALYHEIGCVACHGPSAELKPERKTSRTGVPMPDLTAKTSLDALADFLKNTGDYRPDGHMPQLPMTEQESIDIASHLLDLQGSDPREAPQIKPWPLAGEESIERGRARVRELNCAACHELPGIEKRPPMKIEFPEGYCLTGAGQVRYGLSEQQAIALVTFLRSEKAVAWHRSIESHLARYNCNACHAPRSEGLFTGDPALAEAGRLPPSLNFVGHKLRPEWMEAVISGKEGSRVRPYLRTRMPVYPDRVAKEMTELLQKQNPDLVFPEIAKVDNLAAGRKLIGSHGGANCITCHRWGDRPSLGIQGMDISGLDRRLKPGWFRKYLLNPGAYQPEVLMPALWPGGQSTIKDVLNGDTEKQIGAIWAFIRDGEGSPEGFPNKSEGQFELVPKDRPIIQRTFLEGVGTQAILVGFPGGINLGFDAATAAPRLIWRGRFFDAYNTWFSRSAPLEKPLGGEIHRFSKYGEGRRFLGYEIDPAGNPTFLSASADLRVEEHFAVDGGELVRTTRTLGDGRIDFEEADGLETATVSGESPGVTITRYSWR